MSASDLLVIEDLRVDYLTERGPVRVVDGVAHTHTLVLNSFTRTVSELRVRQPV